MKVLKDIKNVKYAQNQEKSPENLESISQKKLIQKSHIILNLTSHHWIWNHIYAHVEHFDHEERQSRFTGTKITSLTA